MNMKKNKPKYKMIIDAAVKVIAENGYHSSQVSKIAKEAGVADGTIYLYLKNKEDILVSVFEEKIGQFIEYIAKTKEIFEYHVLKKKWVNVVRRVPRQLRKIEMLRIN